MKKNGQQSGKPGEESTGPETAGGGDLGLGAAGKSILQLLPVGVVTFDRDLRIIEANSQASNLIELEDYIDKSLANCMDGATRGGPVWRERLTAVVSSGESRAFENVGCLLNDETRLLRVTCSPLKESVTGEISGGTVIFEDVTKATDIQRRLADSEKLAAVGRLVSKVAHELNNPMDGILRYINLALRIIEQENLEKPHEYLMQCRGGLMRMVQIVSELLEFSRSSSPPTEYVKVENVIDDSVKAMDLRAEAANVEILTHYANGLPRIRGDNLFQVFCNLIKNALDAMPEGGELRISTEAATHDTILAEFSDTGPGFAAEDTDALFEPFFTTKEKGKGTGLGLAICKDIVEQYGGRITAETAADGGSIFSVYLPVGDEQLRGN